jgi:E3 ubiquitin-protein ligase HUWE1
LISIFNEQELELLISGLPDIDIDDWKSNTEYQNYTPSSQQIQWFWRAVRSFDKEELAKLLQFVTGTSKVPLNGFKELEGMNGVNRFNIHRAYGDKNRLPTSHTCFNRKLLLCSDSRILAKSALQNSIFPSMTATIHFEHRFFRRSRLEAITSDSRNNSTMTIKVLGDR